MAELTGVTVKLHVKVRNGIDAFNAPIYQETIVNVENVLVCPVSMENIVTAQQLYGKRAVYDLLIPKGDSNDWENQTVEFYGKKWRTFGTPLEWIEHLVPGNWNRKVTVERYG